MVAGTQKDEPWYERQGEELDLTTTGRGMLKVEILVAGDGINYPKPGHVVSVHYVAYLPDGRVFDATHRRGEK